MKASRESYDSGYLLLVFIVVVVVITEMREEIYGLDQGAIIRMQCQPALRSTNRPIAPHNSQLETDISTIFNSDFKNFKIVFLNFAWWDSNPGSLPYSLYILTTGPQLLMWNTIFDRIYFENFGLRTFGRYF